MVKTLFPGKQRGWEVFRGGCGQTAQCDALAKTQVRWGHSAIFVCTKNG